MSRRPSILLAILVLLLASLAPVASAQTKVETGDVVFTSLDTVRGSAGKGLVEVPVRVSNEGDRARTVEILAGYSTGERWSRAGASVRATLSEGEERELVLTVPSFVGSPGEWLRVDCTVDGSGGETMHLQFVDDQWIQNHLLVAVYSDRALGAGWEQQRAADLSGSSIRHTANDDEEGAFTAPSPRWYPDGMSWRRGRSMTESAARRRHALHLSQPTSDYGVTLNRFEELPRSFAGLTSIDLVVLDGDGLAADQLAEVARWVRLGGSVLVARDGRFSSLGELSRARAPEFQLASFGEVEVARLGLGTVIFAPGDPLGSPDQNLAVWWVHQRLPSWIAPYEPMPSPTREPLRWRMGNVDLPGIGDISHRTVLLLLVALAVVIGPINLWIVRRSQRPVAFLFTGPVFALVGTLLVVAYGTARDGIGIKDAARSWAVLDQQTNTISSLTMRRVFIGLSAGTRMTPGPGTIVLPLTDDPRADSEDRYWIERDEDEGTTVHGGAYLAVRRPILRAVHSDHSTRVRLIAETRDGGVHVENALGANVTELWLRDRSGRLWRTDGELADGAGAALVAADGEEAALRTFLDRLAPGPHLPLFEDLVPGSYGAALADVVGEDDCQIRGTRVSSEQSLIGQLEEGAL